MKTFEELIEEIQQEKTAEWEMERSLSQERNSRKVAFMKKQKEQRIRLFKEMGIKTGPLEKILESGKTEKKKNRESLRKPIMLGSNQSGGVPSRIRKDEAVDAALRPPGIRSLPVHSVSYYSGISSTAESKVLKNTLLPGEGPSQWLWVAEGSEENSIDLIATFTYYFVYYPLVTRVHPVRFTIRFHGNCILTTSTDILYCLANGVLGSLSNIDVHAEITSQTEAFQELPSGQRVKIHPRSNVDNDMQSYYSSSTTTCLTDGQFIDEIDNLRFRDRWFPLRRLQKTVFTNTIRLHVHAFGRDSKAELNFTGDGDYIDCPTLLVVDGQELYRDPNADLNPDSIPQFPFDRMFPFDGIRERPVHDPDFTIPYPG